MFLQRRDFGRLPRIHHVTPLGEIRRVGPVICCQSCAPWSARRPYAVIQGRKGRRHEFDFGDAPVRVEIYSGEKTVEVF